MLQSAVVKSQHNQKPIWLAASLAASYALFCLPAVAQDAQSITFQSSRTAHKISGWEKGLVKRSPNLGKFYWTPITKYTQTTGSRRTSKGAKQVAPAEIATRRTKRYVLSKFAPLPKNDRAEFSASELENSTDVRGSVRFQKGKKQLASGDQVAGTEEVSSVLTYDDGNDYACAEKGKKLSVSGKLYSRLKQSE